jgi:intracellular septation protein
MNHTALLVAFAELGPILAFFVAGRLTDFFTAVVVLMSMSVVAVGISWFTARHIPWLPIVSTLFVLVGGFLTVFLRAPDAIIIADTVYYAAGALLLAIGLWRRTLLLKHLFQAVFAITDTGWRILTWRWIIFLALAAIANETVRILATPEVWVDYRFVKIMVIMAFATYQFTLSRRYRIREESNRWGLRRALNPKHLVS